MASTANGAVICHLPLCLLRQCFPCRRRRLPNPRAFLIISLTYLMGGTTTITFFGFLVFFCDSAISYGGRGSSSYRSRSSDEDVLSTATGIPRPIDYDLWTRTCCLWGILVLSSITILGRGHIVSWAAGEWMINVIRQCIKQ